MKQRPSTWLICGMACCLGMAEPMQAELTIATPESQGVSSDTLRKLSEEVRREGLDVRSMILLRHGKMVLEWYSAGVTREHNHNIYSITKSVVATLAGLAIDDGALKGTDATIAEILDGEPLPEWTRQAPPIRLGDLLTMRSGLPDSRGNLQAGPERDLFDQMHEHPDRLELLLEIEPIRKPGIRFEYSNIDPQWTVVLLEKAWGTRMAESAQRHLFQPLEFRNVAWNYADSKGLVPGGYGLRLRAVDLAKLGQLYLNRGVWDQKRLLPATWIQESTRDQTRTGYGYYWWVRTNRVWKGTFTAMGVRGQQIHVDPQRDLVFVITADLTPATARARLDDLTRNWMLPAILTDTPLQEDSAAQNNLMKELREASRYRPPSRDSLPKARLPQAPLSPPGKGLD